MPKLLLLLLLLAFALTIVLVAGTWLARRWLDRTEDWNPWSDTVTLPVLTDSPASVVPVLVQRPQSGRHRLGNVAAPYRLPHWTTRRQVPWARPAPAATPERDIEVRELSTAS